MTNWTKRTGTPAASSGEFAYALSEVIRRRRAVVLAAFGVVVTSAALVAAFAPDVVRLTAQSGALTATAGLLAGLLAAGIGDATDARIFGARHVRGTGGELIATIPSTPSTHALAGVLAALAKVRADRIEIDAVLRVGVADASAQTHHAAAWTSAIATACANQGERVLEVALATDATNALGVLDVVRDNVPLTVAAQRMSQDMQHARLEAGPNRIQALELLPQLTATLPRNLDTYLVGLPLAASRPVVGAVSRLDVVLVIAEYARTSRVELIAGLDAIESVGVMTQVLLVDDGLWASSTVAKAVHASDPKRTTDNLPAASTPELAQSTPVHAVSDQHRDPNSTERMLVLPRMGRVHDDEEHMLLRATAQQERYVNRPTAADEPRTS